MTSHTVSKPSTSGAQFLPEDAFTQVLPFIDSVELAAIEGVCHSWRKMIGSEDQHIWKNRPEVNPSDYTQQDLAVALSAHHSENSGTITDPTILKLIGAYADSPLSYKQLVTRACLEEVSVDTRIAEEDVGRLGQTLYLFAARRKQNSEEWIAGNLPLHSLFNKFGNCKEYESTIHIRFDNQHRVLKLVTRDEFQNEPDLLPMQITRLVETLLSLDVITQTEVDESVASATKKVVGEWLDD